MQLQAQSKLPAPLSPSAPNPAINAGFNAGINGVQDTTGATTRKRAACVNMQHLPCYSVDAEIKAAESEALKGYSSTE